MSDHLLLHLYQFCARIGLPLDELERLRAQGSEEGPWYDGIFKEVFKLTLKACEEVPPNSLGMFKVGEMYAQGIGTEKDTAKAAEWMRRSVKLDDPAYGAQRARDWLAARGLAT